MNKNLENKSNDGFSTLLSEARINVDFNDRLAVLHELYQQKNAELVNQFQQSKNIAANEFIQNLQFINQPNIIITNNTTSPYSSILSVNTQTNNSLIGSLIQTSSDRLTDDIKMNSSNLNSPNLSKDNSIGNRNCRSITGTCSTISQTTRDRLKTMIASKKQKKQICVSSLRSSSNSNIFFTTISDSSNVNDLSSNNILRKKETINKQFTTSTPHFEPYPNPSPITSASPAIATISNSEFQLRKTNSEPNLKMRLRQRLLNKGSSPVTQSNSFTNNRSFLQRFDSDYASSELIKPVPGFSTTSAPVFTTETNSGLNLQNTLFSNVIIPSPSLPNLCKTVDNNTQLDYAKNLMQASFESFLSLPSLLKNPIFQSNSMLNPCNSSATTNLLIDNFSSPSLPAGGYPSLLKQQLRDLVLRRKSLVREEPENDSIIPNILTQQWTTSICSNNQLKTGLAYDAIMSKHQCLCGENNNHVEHGGRIQFIWSRLLESGLVNMCERISIKKASLDLLKIVHSPTYTTFFAISPTACLKLDIADLPLKSFVQLPCGGIGVDSDTYFNDANTQMAIRVAVGLLVDLSCQVFEGKLRNGFACIRPPGHHAEHDQAMGFCFFNNVSIAARHLKQKFFNICQRIAIIDWDVHHGNGTQLCFESESDILYVSLHRHDNGNFFPGTGAVTEIGVQEGKGFTINIPFSGDVMGDAEYLAAWRVLVLPLLDSFKPDIILVSSGFDATKGHSSALGGYEITPQLFGYFTRSLMSFANGKIVLALEGGYELSSISESAEECVKALCSNGGDICKLSSKSIDNIPNQSAQETIQKVIAVHKNYWPCLTGVQGINTSELHWQTISNRFSSLSVHS